jgi:hypothetical protein
VLATYLLHDASFALGKSNVATRLIADKLNLNLATFAPALLVVVIIVIGNAIARTLNATVLGRGRVAIACVAIVQLLGSVLVVLVGDVGHCGIGAGWYHERNRQKNGGDAVLVVVPTAYTGSGVERRGSVLS